MKKILIFAVIAVILTLSINSCTPEPGGNEEEGNFWAQNTVTDKFYKFYADKLYENAHCTVWVERNSNVTSATAEKIGNEYSTQIRPKMVSAFGWTASNTDTMSYADTLGDGDGKLCILLLDIKDDYEEGVNDSYVAGYFYAVDFFNDFQVMSEGVRSNERDMIYIDTYPGLDNADDPDVMAGVFRTLAHEMQHLMNFVTTAAIRSNVNENGQITDLFPMDTWIDEGLSSAAEYIYNSVHPPIRWHWYNSNGGGEGRINKGNNFFVWGNYKNEMYAILDDYATVYLFFQWLRLQSGVNSSKIYKDIMVSSDSDYKAVTSSASSNIENGYNTWEKLLGDWLSANFINNTSGRYGYMNDSTLKQIKAPYAPKASSIWLSPGEGVYSYADNSTFPSQSGNIRYAGLSSSGRKGTIANGETLLSFNVNPTKTGNSENATMTNNTPPAPPSPNINIAGSRSADGIQKFKGPFPIGAEGIIRNIRDLDLTGISMRGILPEAINE